MTRWARLFGASATARLAGFAGVGGLAIVAVIWFGLLGPVQLGGPAGYVVTRGDSMEPGIAAGDLVVTREASKYDVGDVVAYHNPDIDHLVLHRIVERDGDRYALQGDGNDWVDSHRPEESEIVGRKWLHLPRVGATFLGLRAPLAVGVAAGVLLFGRRRRREALDGHDDLDGSRPPQRSKGWQGWRGRSPTVLSTVQRASPATLVVAAVAVGLLVLSVVAWAQPSTVGEERTVTYRHRGRLTYGAEPAPGPAYSGPLRTGDPIFLSRIDELDLEYRYGMRSDSAASVGGVGRLDLRVHDHEGWEQVLEVVAPTAFEDELMLSGSVDLAALRERLRAVEEATGSRPGRYGVEVVAAVEIEAEVTGEVRADTVTHLTPFDLDAVSLRPRLAGGEDRVPLESGAIVSEDEGSMLVPARRPARLSLPGVGVSVGATRWWTLLLGSAAALGAWRLLVRDQRWRRLPEHEQIAARYGSWLVSVDDALVDGGDVLRLERFDDLMVVAQRHELPILWQPDGDRYVYAVRVGTVWYSYSCAAERRVAPPEGRSEHPEHPEHPRGPALVLHRGGVAPRRDRGAVAS